MVHARITRCIVQRLYNGNPSVVVAFTRSAEHVGRTPNPFVVVRHERVEVYRRHTVGQWLRGGYGVEEGVTLCRRVSYIGGPAESAPVTLYGLYVYYLPIRLYYIIIMRLLVCHDVWVYKRENKYCFEILLKNPVLYRSYRGLLDVV